MARAERIGIVGGTFDPVHVGHLMDAAAARYQLELDRVLVVVARDPWQKRDRLIAPAEVRYEMVVAALDRVAGIEASRIELEREGPTYTIDTVESLVSPERELFLVLGSDVAEGLASWHRVDDLRALVTLAIVDREPTPLPAPAGWRVERVSVPRLELSSTDLRTRVAAGEPIDFLVPTPAARISARTTSIRPTFIELMAEISDNYYRSAGTRDRHERGRRWDRRAQIAVALLAVIAGVVAGMMGTHKTWEKPAPTLTPVTRPAG